MKTEDFELLKAVCEKEGFEISIANRSLKDVFEIHKKDSWEGVEFVEILVDWNGFKVGSIGRIIEEKFNGYIIFSPIGESNSILKPNAHYAKDLEVIKPSTEQAYVGQLKKEAFERFGEIKGGDRFERSWCILKPISTIRAEFESDFKYYKHRDTLCFKGTGIYSKGKWAERVKESVEIEFLNKKEFGHRLDLHFQLSDKSTLDYEGCQFLTQQLEKYLNNEIE